MLLGFYCLEHAMHGQLRCPQTCQSPQSQLGELWQGCPGSGVWQRDYTPREKASIGGGAQIYRLWTHQSTSRTLETVHVAWPSRRLAFVAQIKSAAASPIPSPFFQHSHSLNVSAYHSQSLYTSNPRRLSQPNTSQSVTSPSKFCPSRRREARI